MKKKKFIFCPFGSGGDVNPHVWLARAMMEQGHEGVLITAPLFESVIKNTGLKFRGVGTEDEYQRVVDDPRLWNPWRAPEVVFGASARMLERFFEVIREEVIEEREKQVVLVAPFHMPAARLAREVLQVPLITVHLQPIVMFSAYDEAILLQGMKWLSRLPVWLKSLLWRLPNPVAMGLGREVKRLCVKHRVTVPRNWLMDWVHSPDAVLCLWPEWFAKRQPDWPVHAKTIGFPLEDLQGQYEMPNGLREFINGSDKPVLLTAGTGNAQAKKFFETGINACAELGRKMLLGTKFREQLPEVLPKNSMWFEYLPFTQLLPQVAAIVHHGGIGTMSQAFAAGVPQVVLPLAHDQPDNGARMEKLGTGLVAGQLSELASALTRVLEDENMRRRCQEVATWLEPERAKQAAIEVMENVTHIT